MLKVLQAALAEVGYTEGAGNVTKYAEYLDSLPGFYNGKKNGYAWCDVFVDWCFVTAYGRALAQKLLCQPDNSAGAGCTYSAQYYRAAGRFSTVPQVGAQVFFGNSTESYHTGLLYDMDDAYIYTVEGNTSNGVFKRRYRRDDGSIYGYGMPDYSLVDGEGSGYADDYGEDDEVVYVTPSKATTTQATCTLTLPELRQGNVDGKPMGAVWAMQTLLIARHFACGADGADGDYGPATAQAVKNLQTDKGLTVDGIVGANTWANLIKG
jgi:peptidoglycan hydrolase-like protein with peptidoglycan-binding domain